MNSFLLRNWFSVVLSFLGVFNPMSIQKESIPALQTIQVVHTIKPAVAVTRKAQPASHLSKGIRAYTYIFAGKALDNGQPSASAEIVLELTTSNGTEIHRIKTAQDGSYQIAASLLSKPNDMVRWTINAETTDHKTLSLEGHQIPLYENRVAINGTLYFAEI
jgi:hypothetical protein